VGELNLNLSDIQITDLSLDVGVGSVNINLPEPDGNRYEVTINGGVGDTNITLPEGVAVRLEASFGVGEVNVNYNALERIDGNNDSDGSIDGIWETDDFSRADSAIIIVFDGGVGELNIR